jgi:hypothetical protein
MLPFVLLFVLLLTGCAATTPSTNPAVAFAYGRISAHLAAACGESPTLSGVACKDIKAADSVIRKAILTPPVAPAGGITAEQLAELLGLAIGAAK